MPHNCLREVIAERWFGRARPLLVLQLSAFYHLPKHKMTVFGQTFALRARDGTWPTDANHARQRWNERHSELCDPHLSFLDILGTLSQTMTFC